MSPAFATDQSAIAVVRNRLMRTLDGGASWGEIVTNVHGMDFETAGYNPNDPTVVLLGTNNDGVMHRSVDAGSSWVQSNTGIPLTSVTSISWSTTTVDTVVVAGSPNSVAFSVDGGLTWTAGGAGPAQVDVLTHTPGGDLLAGDINGVVWRSNDNGATWAVLHTAASSAGITAVQAGDNSAAGVTILVGTELGELFRSMDDGATFATAGLALPAEEIQSIALSPMHDVDDTAWLSSRTDGAFISTDGGVTWSLSDNGLTVTAQAAQLGRANFGQIVAGSNGAAPAIFLGGFDGLFLSVDGGVTWSTQHTHVDYLVGLALSPDFANDQTLLVTTYVKGAYVSTDGGATWQNAHTGLGHVRDGGNGFAAVRRLYNAAISPDFANDGRMFTVTPNRFAYSDDLGVYWNEVGVSTPTPPIRGPVIAPSPDFAVDQTVFFGTLNGDVHKSTAAGESAWVHLSNVGSRIRSMVVSPDFTNDATLFVGATDGVAKSVDGGLTWTPVGPTGGSPQLAISPNYELDQTVFSATSVGLHSTNDGGTTWTPVVSGPLTATSHIEAVAISPDYANDGVVLVSEESAGLLESLDGGVTFAATGADLLANNLVIAEFNNPTEVPIEFSPDFANDQTVFAYGQQDLVKSTDGGSTWQFLSLPPAVEMLGQPEIIARTGAPVIEPGTGNTVIATIPLDLSHPAVFDVEVDWATVDNSGDPGQADHADVNAASGTVVWAEGNDRLFIEVEVTDDNVAELLETLEVELSNPVNATIATGSGFVDIIDDDPLPSVKPLGVLVNPEGDSGSSFHELPAVLSHPSSTPITVDYVNLDIPTDPTIAASGSDHAAFSGTLTFAPGETVSSFSVEVFGDTEAEPPTLWGEWGVALFSNQSANATLDVSFFGLGLFVIVDDD